MAETKFTPGPWSIFGPLSDKYEPAYRVSAERTLSLTVSPCPDGFVQGENKANAHLIAAAPDLYEALELILELRSKELGEWLLTPNAKHLTLKDYAQAALAKARGEEMAKVELTPDKLAELKKKAAGCDPKYWIMDQHGDVVAVDFDNKSTKLKIASVDFLEDAEHIAAADPATVLALVEEIEILKTALNLLMCQYYSTDLEHEDIDKLCKGQIEIAKKHRKSEAGHGK